jgi:hypothetical protein
MALESAYLHALDSSTAYQVVEPNQQVVRLTLYLTGGAADLTFTPAG